MLDVNDFNAVRISLASPEQIRGWSYGEVTKPETINYRTLKPEKDGLFCERIFGPTKDFECYCGKYKRVRYKGIICDKCGVEIARSKVRRERMGHIELAAPVAHIWFARGTPSRLALLLDISPRMLERVVYFNQYIVTHVDEDARKKLTGQLRDDALREVADRQARVGERSGQIGLSLEEEVGQLESEKEVEGERVEEERAAAIDADIDQRRQAAVLEMGGLRRQFVQERGRLEGELSAQIEELEDLRPLMPIPEAKYRVLKEKFGSVFNGGMGAEAILDILSRMDMEKLRKDLRDEMNSSSGQRRKKAAKRLRLIEALHKSGNKPVWMILTVLPVLPPELRPMVQLDGGRFATSDLNELYRRVINRNNRLRRLLEMRAPEIIIRNEKRMLQEAVDALIDNGRRGRAVAGTRNHKLKSLSDMLGGKQGRFRQNLLGKRVDYSGRSVIVVGPELQLNQCGLPRRMALELFKPFVMHYLVGQGYAHNIKSAKRVVERVRPEVWDALEHVIKGRPVLLNRAPTLHRLGIQAFEPVLIDGSAIQIHPLVCQAFNADFDGDQMAVHVPLSRPAVREAREVMISSHNMLSPSSGDPIIAPRLDMVVGCYYLTIVRPGGKGEGMTFSSFDEAKLAYDLGIIELQAEIGVRRDKASGDRLKTSVGRIIFNEALPPELGFRNMVMDSKALKQMIADCYKQVGNEGTALVADRIKQLGFEYATKSGITIAINDLQIPEGKDKLLQEGDVKVADVESQFRRGLMSEEERSNSVVDIWTQVSEEMSDVVARSLDPYGSISMMANSGAKGNIAQIKQMIGMRGLMADPAGRIIELPIRSNFREGLTALEYFISTHGARKGLADTALRTADSGYLTRRLIDVAQDSIILEEDCGATAGLWLSDASERGLLESLSERIIGRLAASRIVHPQTGEIIVERNEEIDEEKAAEIASAGIGRVYVRSPLTCQSRRGVCQDCYGRNPATGRLVAKGEAVGIIAAQSIGEPGTQLTMRTFHTGGVAGVDITSGLPRVEELFEARVPKGQAIVSEIDGVVEILTADPGRQIRVVSSEMYHDDYRLPEGYELVVRDDEWVDAGTELARASAALEAGVEERQVAVVSETASILARLAGTVSVEGDRISVWYEEREERLYPVPATAHIILENGDRVRAGDKLTEGPLNPQDALRIMGREAVQLYLVEEVQKVYRSQGVNINDKHIEVIVHQMLRKVRVDSPGDTDMLPGELVDRFVYEDTNAKVLAEGGEPATAQTALLGVTKAALNTDSFLAAASFQETTRVLTEAAVTGAIDRLQGLKENVIIGKLIPAHAVTPAGGAPSFQLEEGRPASEIGTLPAFPE